jgi:katanin p60 ATPase-containing subunit A1
VSRIDLHTPLSIVATRTREAADAARHAGRYAEAADRYAEAALLERRRAESAGPGNRGVSSAAAAHAVAHLEGLAIKMRRSGAGERGGTTSSAVRPPPPPPPQSLPSEEADRIKALRVVGHTSWDQIVGHDAAKATLRWSVRLITAASRDTPAGHRLDPPQPVLLYGPPGTGKSMLASAVAAERGCAFFAVGAADLMSKWFGESSRLAAELFGQARAETAAVVFVDEVDALCRGRDGADVNGAERRLLATILAEMSGVRDDGGAVLTMAATNAPWDLDPAALSRFGRRVYVPLPDAAARAAVVAAALDRQGLTVEGGSVADVARAADGRSGRQLTGVVRAAVERMLARLNPAGPGGDRLAVGPIRVEELLAEVRAVPPDVTPAALQRYQAFAAARP